MPRERRLVQLVGGHVLELDLVVPADPGECVFPQRRVLVALLERLDRAGHHLDEHQVVRGHAVRGLWRGITRRGALSVRGALTGCTTAAAAARRTGTSTL